MGYKEFDCVRVSRAVPAYRIDASLSSASTIAIGDVGTVLHVQTGVVSDDDALLVECVERDGRARWVAQLLASEVEAVSRHDVATS